MRDDFDRRLAATYRVVLVVAVVVFVVGLLAIGFGWTPN